jgi:meso-butanediol dehydrogenase / (S,S)-butanediol dehydrogenase / diacetyl reductase
MTGRLEGKAIIVTGAGSGMGRAFAIGLAQEGATVGVLDVNGEAAAAVREEVAGQGLNAVSLRADVSSRWEVAAAFGSFVARTGKLDVLFNNAGFNRPMRLLDVTEENWHAIMDVNGLGTLIGIQEGARHMIPRRSGKIINTSSIAGRQGYPSFAPYCASKFAVNALTQAAARALAEHNITCNAFAPGVVETPLWDRLDADLMSIGDSDTPGQAMAEFASGIIIGRSALPADIVGTALYLASPDSDYMTGQIVMIDGGMVLVLDRTATSTRARDGRAPWLISQIGVIMVAVSEVEKTPPAGVGVNLGLRLREARIRSGLTLREVARQLGVSASFVSQLENGKSRASVVTLYSLTQLLGVSIDQMFEPDGDVAASPGKIEDGAEASLAPPADTPADAGGYSTAGRQHGDARESPAEVSRIRRSDLGSPKDAWPQQEARPHLVVTSPGSRRRLVMDWGVIWDQLAPNSGRYFDFMEIVYPPGSSSTNDDHMLRHSGFESGYLLEGELEVTCGFEVVTLRPGDALGMDSAVPHLLRNRGSVAARGIWCVHHDH